MIALYGNLYYNKVMDKRICRVICAGERCPLTFEPQPGDLTIAADGGYAYALEAGITPDIVLGDFDSLDIEPHGNVMRLSPIKDVTDTFAAAEEGLARGYRTFEFYCCTGGRLSHTLANIATLRYIASRGGKGVMKGRGCEIYVCSSQASISGEVYFSLIPSGAEAKVEIRNAAYSGSFALTDRDSLGVSNEPLKNKIAAVTVHDGEVIVIVEEKRIRVRGSE